MKSINNFKPYCIFIESNDILEAIKNERDNSILIIEMPLISKFIIYQKIIKALKKTINDLKLSKKLYKYSLISDLVIRRYDKNFSKNYGGGRFHQDINFYRTSKSVSIWILLQGDEYSQRLEFILDDDLEVKLNIESGVEIFESITNGRKIVKLPPLSSGNNCVIFSGLTPHRPSRGGERISIDFRINSFSNIFEVSLFFLNYFFVISIIKIKIFIKYIIFNLIKFNKF